MRNEFLFFGELSGMVSWIVNKLQKPDRVDGIIDNLVDRMDDWVSQFEENSKLTNGKPIHLVS